MDRLSDLPEHILQKILCFLSQDEAAQTSVLSKKWRDLWITRPKVAFSNAYFKGTKQEFVSTVNNTLRRYHHQNLSLDELHLSLSDHESFWLLEEWIPRLTHMGVKEFHLSIASKREYRPLPLAVFDAGCCLQELHVRKYKLVHHHHHQKIIALRNLKRLHLDRVHIEDEEILHNIISSCPSIETLRFQECDGLTRVELDNHSNLKDLSFSEYRNLSQDKCCSIEIRESPSLKSIRIELSRISWFQPQEFQNLNHLHLTYVRLSVPNQLSSCKFPCLKYLTLSFCYGFEESHLFVDAPKIVRFSYGGQFIPSISFASSSTKWDSIVYLSWQHLSNDDSLWLLKLSKLLKSLSQSSMSLYISHNRRNQCQHFEGNGLVVQQPVGVERLQLSCDSFSFPCLLNALFRICHPTTLGDYSYNDKEVTKLLCKIFMQRESGKEDGLRQFWFRDVEDVRMEIFEKNGLKWDATSLSEYLKPESKTGDFKYTRFRLKWRSRNLIY